MKLYLAGSYSRECVVKLYLASTCNVENYVKVYLAGAINGNLQPGYRDKNTEMGRYVCKNIDRVYLLESFYYIKPWQVKLIPMFKGFMLDSGAFTFMSGNCGNIDFEQYTKDYADFINKYDIDLFFEIDIDSVVPWQQYLDLRKMLEDLTGKVPIPVFHKNRGKEWFQNAVRKHNYIAIGGIVTGEIKRKEFKILQWFIEEAHRNDCKIHGLGFTNLKWLPKLRWDSVDSSSWLYGNRSGVIYKFNGSTITKHKGQEGARLKPKKAAIHNFNEWVKFSEYMDRAYA